MSTKMRLSLELLALERASQRLDKKALKNLVAEMRKLLELHDKSPTSLPYELDYSLHDLIISSCRNPYLQHTYERLMANIQRYRNVIRKIFAAGRYELGCVPNSSSISRSAMFILKGDTGQREGSAFPPYQAPISIVSEKLSNSTFPIPLTKGVTR